ncbi:hypothetical protein ACS0TY_006084 [Phlomoides rotata]
MSWFWAIIFLVFALSTSSEANHHHKSSAVIVGTVYCDTCFQQNIKNIHFISGASVAVACKDTSSTPSFRAEVKTDSHGEFKVHLPSPISKHVNKIKGCSVRLISSNKPYCAVAATATSSNLYLKSRKEGTHVFSAGFFTFRPLKEPQVCDQKPRKNNNFKKPMKLDEKLSQISNPNDPTFLPPIHDPPSDPPALGGFLPPLPRLPPLPQLPLLPPLPKLPFLPPLPKNEAANKTPKLTNSAINNPDTFQFPPNPFNPPSVFPPNPFQPTPSVIPPTFPTPPSSVFPPIFPLPSSPPFFNLPPFPGLPPSPPPPSSSFPVPLPPFPFQPTPGSPGVPSAEVSSPSKTSSP